MNQKQNYFSIKLYTSILIVAWTVLLIALFLWDIDEIRKESLEILRIKTSAAFEKDILYRRWNAMHGGVYAPVTEKTLPNPFLSDHPERDITTPSGKQLTLINPAYMSRQAYELEREFSDIRSHITSLNPIKPENVPDAWEKKALEEFELGKKEVVSIDTFEAKEYYRLMRPLITEKRCLTCHAKQGYKENDIRGGISVSVPLDKVQQLYSTTVNRHLSIHILIWLIGSAIIVFGYKRLHKSELKRSQAEASLLTAYDDLEDKVQMRTAELRESEHLFKTLAEVAPVGIFRTDAVGKTIYVNPRWCEISQMSFENAMGDGWLNAVHPDDRTLLAAKWQQTVETQSVSKVEYRFLRPDGSIAWVFGQAIPQKNEMGTITAYIGTITDITERKRSEEILNEKENKYHTLFESANDAIFTMIGDKFVDCNAMTLSMFGCEKKEDILGHHPWEFSPHLQPDGRDSKEKASEVIQAALAGHPQRFYWLHTKKNGELFDAEVSLNRLTIGNAVFIQALVRDITERKRAESELEKYRKHLEDLVKERTAELEAAKERAESADKLKSAFLATMSHELRTPLNSIIGFTGILLKEIPGSLNPEQKKQLGMVQNSAWHLLSLINDVLDISKIEAGQLELHYEKFKINDVIKNVVGIVAPMAESKGLELKVEIQPDLDEIYSDQRRVNQILLNIINNAVKFTEKGIIKVESFQSKNDITVKVTDTGIGIEKDKFEYIFKPFSQVDTGLTRKHEGTGLGLSISKKLITMLNGSISVESEVGVGSVFTITLPK